MAKVWGLDIPAEFSAGFAKFLKLNWQGSTQRVCIADKLPALKNSQIIAGRSYIPEFAADWAALSERQQQTWFKNYGDGAQQAFALYTQNRWYRMLGGLPKNDTADIFSSPVGHIHIADGNDETILQFTIEAGDLVLSNPSNWKKPQEPIACDFSQLSFVSFAFDYLMDNVTGSEDLQMQWRAGLFWTQGGVEYEYWLDWESNNGNYSGQFAGTVDNMDFGPPPVYWSKIVFQVRFSQGNFDLWLFNCNCYGIDLNFGTVRFHDLNFFDDFNFSFSGHLEKVKNKWSMIGLSGDSFFNCVYPFDNGFDLPDSGWYFTHVPFYFDSSHDKFDCSDDGAVQIAIDYTSRIYTSFDYGKTWAESRPAGNVNRNYIDVKVSGDGLTFIVVEYQGRIWRSTNAGASWSELRPGGDVNYNWYYCATDYDGSFLFVASLYGSAYVSTDGGANWSETKPTGTAPASYGAITCDSDGSFLMAGGNSGRLYISTDGGANWSETKPAGAVSRQWYNLKCDSDGSHIIALTLEPEIFISTDGGANWSLKTPGGFSSGYWYGAFVDSDGSHFIVAGAWVGVFLSSDSGANWSELKPMMARASNWGFAVLSADGSKKFVGPAVNGFFQYL